jgi:hypothetical protein
MVAADWAQALKVLWLDALRGKARDLHLNCRADLVDFAVIEPFVTPHHQAHEGCDAYGAEFASLDSAAGGDAHQAARS